MQWRDLITLDPAILAGKPVIKGTRLAVEFITSLRLNIPPATSSTTSSGQPITFEHLSMKQTFYLTFFAWHTIYN